MFKIKEMKKYADQKMCDGCNCCEAVLWSFLNTMDEKNDNVELYKLATIFGGGIASTREEICGALTGAMMVLSIRGGRTDCEISNDALMAQGQKLRTAFIEKIGPTKCIALRDKLEKEYGTVDCKKVVQDCIELLELIEPET